MHIIRLVALAFVASTIGIPASSSAAADACVEARTAIPPVPCVAGDSGDPAPRSAAPCVPLARVDDRCESWVAVEDYAGGHGTTGIDSGFGVVHSPDGATLYVTGQSWDDVTNYDILVTAYEAETGRSKWSTRWNAPGDRHDIPTQIVTSHDGSVVYVSGHAHMGPVGEGADYATLALDAAGGEMLWSTLYGAPENDDSAIGLAVSNDDRFVYVTGKSGSSHDFDVDYATIAYDAETGEQRWVSQYARVPGGGEDVGVSVATSPDGSLVYVAGAAGVTVTTLAYAASDGALVWKHEGTRGYGYWLDVSPDGARVYVSGSAHISFTSFFPNWQFVTYALDARTGARIWERRLLPPDRGLNVPYDQDLSADGTALVVAGTATEVSFPFSDSYIAVLDAATGAVRWEDRMTMPGATVEIATAATFARDEILTTSMSAHGSTATAITRGFRADGWQNWVARWNDLDDPTSGAIPSAVSASATGYAVTGRIQRSKPVRFEGDPVNGGDILTLSYPIAPALISP